MNPLLNLQAKLEYYTPLEIRLKSPDDFLKVKETLTRIGVASKKDKTLYQTCHILHKQGRYYLMMFKELFVLDGKPADITENDVHRRNTIANLLLGWNLIEVNEMNVIECKAPLSQIKVISFREKPEWNLVSKYTVGQFHK